MLLAAPQVITPREVLEPGWLAWEGGVITAVGSGEPPGAVDVRLPWARVVPGLVDVHAHGGGGASFATTDTAEIGRVLTTHRRHGTTTMLASLVTADRHTLSAQVTALGDAVSRGELAGIHLEGPWLSPAYAGAHDRSLLRSPEQCPIDDLLARAPGAIRMVTVAPELPGALAAIAALTGRGVVAAVGHTAATTVEATAAIDAGARGATHLFNAMPPLRHRDPGPVGVLWSDPRVFVEVIFDGVHLAPRLAAFVLRAAGGRGVLVSDSMAAAGQRDGAYLLGRLPVTVTAGVARLTGTETIAGSTLTLDRAVRNACAAGIALPDAITAATLTPSRYLGLEQVGSLEPGRRADLIALDDALRVRAVLRGGEWLTHPPA